jgi:hypothetical protein
MENRYRVYRRNNDVHYIEDVVTQQQENITRGRRLTIGRVGSDRKEDTVTRTPSRLMRSSFVRGDGRIHSKKSHIFFGKLEVFICRQCLNGLAIVTLAVSCSHYDRCSNPSVNRGKQCQNEPMSRRRLPPWLP